MLPINGRNDGGRRVEFRWVADAHRDMQQGVERSSHLHSQGLPNRGSLHRSKLMCDLQRQVEQLGANRRVEHLLFEIRVVAIEDGRRDVVRSRGSSTSLRSGERSEEHTSELQSLMRISYAVSCLKKK